MPAAYGLRDVSPLVVNSQYCAVILSAGKSSRMGEEKAALPWIGGEPLLAWMMRELELAGWQSFTVVAPERYEFWHNQFPTRIVLNPDPARGKTSSVACGIAAIPESARWILIAAVDQPRPPSLYRCLRKAVESSEAKIVLPEAGKHRGHPPVVSAKLRGALLRLEERSQGLRCLLDAHADRTLRVPVAGYREWDLNTPELYRRALDEAVRE